MEKVYVLTETTYDDGYCLDTIIGIFKTIEEANIVMNRLESKMEELGYSSDDTWLSVSEYAVGIINPVHVWYEDCGFERREWN